MNPKLNQALIPPVENVRDLGIYFSSNLSFHYHYSLIIQKSHQRINMLFSILKNASWSVFIKCYTIYIRRHKYHLKSLIKNSTKISSQFLSNRVIRCWNSLPAKVFPVKPSSAAFKNRLLFCDLKHFLALNSTNY
ncbi:Protein CBG27389 [Caenorhabditis briggsae]|uniref:Protein CBG27389 n=1 Tax=Caenorhabditis briggsae TaxID=6238 RepID=B6IH05_CAEBR|nr:Protein CBG27389 [Caenorhabditis briggsae]CAR99185.1 Protein CBG27389 [Caenorhabditis briggsae]